MAVSIVSQEEIVIDGLPYIKKTYSNGAVTTELNIPPEPEPESEPEPVKEWIDKDDLDAAYAAGVNAYQGE